MRDMSRATARHHVAHAAEGRDYESPLMRDTLLSLIGVSRVAHRRKSACNMGFRLTAYEPDARHVAHPHRGF